MYHMGIRIELCALMISNRNPSSNFANAMQAMMGVEQIYAFGGIPRKVLRSRKTKFLSESLVKGDVARARIQALPKNRAISLVLITSSKQ